MESKINIFEEELIKLTNKDYIVLKDVLKLTYLDDTQNYKYNFAHLRNFTFT